MQPFKLKIEATIDSQRLRNALCYHAAVFGEPMPNSKRAILSQVRQTILAYGCDQLRYWANSLTGDDAGQRAAEIEAQADQLIGRVFG